MKLPYFKLGEAFNEAKDSFSRGNNVEKLTSSAKLVTKSLANIGMLAAEAGVHIVKSIPETAGKYAQENIEKRSHLMTEEQLQKSQEIVKRGNEARKKREEEELLRQEQKERDRKNE